MSLSAKNITQGGQITAYNLRMYIQINSWVGFWAFVLFAIFFGFGFYLITPGYIWNNGALYWLSVMNQSLSALNSNVGGTFDVQYFDPVRQVMIPLKMTMQQMVIDPYMQAMGQHLVEKAGYAAIAAGVVATAFFTMVTWYLGKKGKEHNEDEYISGQQLVDDPAVVNRLLKGDDKLSDLKIGGLHLVRDSEMQNISMHGTVGTGKSTAIRELLDTIRKRGDRVIIWDSGCTFIESHYNPEKDTILNPYDQRCANWDLWGECSAMPDYDNMASALIPADGENSDPFWVSSARTIFAATAHRMSKDPDRNITKFLQVLLSLSIKNLRSYLAKTEAASLVEEKIEKTAISIRSVITNYVKSLRYLQGLDKSGKPQFTIRDWMTNPDMASSCLFISADAKQKSSLRPLISMWLSLAIIHLMSMGESRTRRVWFFLDELPGLQRLPDLPSYMAEARKFGGCFVIGFQNSPQLMQIYGTKLGASLFDLLNTRMFFRSPSAEVAMLVEKELGRQRRKEARQQNSYGPDPIRDGVSMSKQSLQEPIVDYDSVMCLPDLSCYVRLIGEYPVVKLQLTRKEAKVKYPGLIERNFDDSLDPKIEKLISQNEGSAAALDALFTAEPSMDSTAPDVVSELESQATPDVATVAAAAPDVIPVPKPVFSPLAFLKKGSGTGVVAASDDGESLEKRRNQQTEEGSNSESTGSSSSSRMGRKGHIEPVIGSIPGHDEDCSLQDGLPEGGDMVQAMFEEEKNILRHHRPDDAKYYYGPEVEREGGFER